MASPRAAASAGSCDGQMSHQPAAATAAALLVAAAVGAALDRNAPRRTVAAVAAAAIQACLQARESKCAVLGSLTEAGDASDPSGARRRRGGKRGDRRRRRRAEEAKAAAPSPTHCAGPSSGPLPAPKDGEMQVAQPGATPALSALPTSTKDRRLPPSQRAGGQKQAQPPGLAPVNDCSHQDKKSPLQALLSAEREAEVFPYRGAFFDEDNTEIPTKLDGTEVQSKGQRRRRGADQHSRK